MSPAETPKTQLIVLHGKSGSSKSATAWVLCEHLGRRLALGSHIAADPAQRGVRRLPGSVARALPR